MVVKPVKKFPASYVNLKLISPVYILAQVKQVHGLPSYFPSIYFNIILPFMPRSSKRYLSFRNPSPKIPLSHCSSVPCPTQLILLNLINLKTIGQGTNHEDPNYAVLSCLMDNLLEQDVSDQ
jgi:hypothetical protein